MYSLWHNTPERGLKMEIKAEIYQFLSRGNILNHTIGPVGSAKTSSKQRPDIIFSIDYEIIDKPFELNFIQVAPGEWDVGASQYVDPEIDTYMEMRWPKCLKGKANICVETDDVENIEALRSILTYFRLYTWSLWEHVKILRDSPDQFATVPGYRRQYIHTQSTDIAGNRRPSSSESYTSTGIGEIIGPGVTVLPNTSDPSPTISPIAAVIQRIDHLEFVWSQIIPFPEQSNLTDDLPEIREKVKAIRLHYSTYDELHRARKYLSDGEIKAAIRFGAASMEVILRYYCKMWGVKFPTDRISFDEKIERVLSEASKPSYRDVDPTSSKNLLYLYRARSSMHEGDCSYKDDHGSQIRIKRIDQAEGLVKAAEEFTIWIDSIT